MTSALLVLSLNLTPAQPLSPYKPTLQELVANYKRANSLQEIAKGGVTQLTLEPNWARENTFTFQKDLGNGKSQWIIVKVGDRAEMTPAFDQKKLDEAVSKASGKPFEGEVSNVRFDATLTSFTFSTGATTYKCTLPGYSLTPATAPTPLNRQRGGGGQSQLSNEVQVKEGKLTLGSTGAQVGTSSDFFNGYLDPTRKHVLAFKLNPGDRRKALLLKSTVPGTTRAVLEERLYDQPGDKLDTYDPYVVDVQTGKEIKVPIDSIMGGGQPWSYPPTPTWSESSGKAYIDFPIRGYQENKIVELDMETGAARTIVDEKEPTFVDQSNFKWRLDDTNHMLFVRSERDGWGHLYAVDLATATVKNQVTKGQWVVRDIVQLDPKSKTILFTACGRTPGEDPYQIHTYRVNYDGSNLQDLTPADGSHTVNWSPGRSFYVDSYSRADMPPVFELRRGSDAKLMATLARADASKLATKGLKSVERFVAKGRDGKTDIYGIAVYPSHFDPSKTYPVIENIYAGPHDSFTPKTYRPFLNMSRLAELGFIVVQMDGMGTNNRGKAFHDVCYKNIRDAGFPDRIAWMRAFAAKHPQADISRVGIYGTSAGGQNSMAAMLWHNDFYKAAVSACGCHDNRIDKQWWNEQWMGYPVGPEYDQQSNITNAKLFKGKLLLIVGENDRNVPPETTYRLASELEKAGKNFDFVVIPGADHTDGGPYGEHKRRDFFVKNLLGVDPPEWDLL